MTVPSGMGRTMTSLSQLLNVIVFGGYPDETVSARSHRQGRLLGDIKWSRRADMIDRLFRDPTHCITSHAKDIAFARILLSL